MTPTKYIALAVLPVLAAVWLFGGTPAVVPLILVLVAAVFVYAIGRLFLAVIHRLER